MIDQFVRVVRTDNLIDLCINKLVLSGVPMTSSGDKAIGPRGTGDRRTLCRDGNFVSHGP